MQTSASKSCAMSISSIESAISSRETSEARMPGVACDWLSETAIVLNASGTPPAASTPRPTAAARSRWLRLHGIVCVHIDAMPDDRLVEPVGVDPHRPEVRAGARALVAVRELLAGSLFRGREVRPGHSVADVICVYCADRCRVLARCGRRPRPPVLAAFTGRRLRRTRPLPGVGGTPSAPRRCWRWSPAPWARGCFARPCADRATVRDRTWHSALAVVGVGAVLLCGGIMRGGFDAYVPRWAASAR